MPVHNNLGAPNFDSRINDVYSSGYELEHVLNDSLKVRQSLRYTGLDVDYKWSFPYFDGRIDPKTLAIFSTKSPYTEGLFTVDNNAVLTWGNKVKHTFLLGVDYRWANRADSYSEADAGTIDIYHPVYSHELGPFFHWEDSESTLSQTGFYFQEQAKLGEHLTVLIGGRKDLADAKNVYTDFSAGAPIRNASVQTDEAFTWRGGLVYLFNNGLAPYFSYSQAFEPVLGVDRLNNPFEPTTAEQYEAGIKFQPKGKQSFVTLSAFDITRANVLTPDPIDPNESIQTGEVTSQGFEAEATLDLSSGWKSIATYTYTYAIVTDSNDPAEIGTYFEAVPLNMASLWLLYEFQHGRMKGWGLGGGVRYVGDTFNRLNTLELPEYTLVDAVLQYKTGTVGVRAQRPQHFRRDLCLVVRRLRRRRSNPLHPLQVWRCSHRCRARKLSVVSAGRVSRSPQGRSASSSTATPDSPWRPSLPWRASPAASLPSMTSSTPG